MPSPQPEPDHPFPGGGLSNGRIVAESVSIRNQLLFLAGAKGTPCFYFCSTTPGEGTTSSVLTLGMVLARHCGNKVLMVDLSPDPGPLAAQLVRGTKEGHTDPAAFTVSETIIENFHLGHMMQKTGEAGRLAALDRLVREDSEGFDIKLIDGNALQMAPDLSPLKEIIDGVVLVIESGKNSADFMAKIKRHLDTSGHRLLGAIMNKKKGRIPPFIEKRL